MFEEMKVSDQKAIKLLVEGKEYVIRKPKIKDQRALNKMLKGISENSEEQTDVMMSWLASLGLPIEVAEEMYAVDLKNLIENHLVDDKKK